MWGTPLSKANRSKKEVEMAGADLDVVIRRSAKDQNRTLMDAAKKRREHFLTLAAKAKDKAAKDRHRQAAKDTMLHATAIAKRLQISAENAADSYLRAMKRQPSRRRQINRSRKRRRARRSPHSPRPQQALTTVRPLATCAGSQPCPHALCPCLHQGSRAAHKPLSSGQPAQ
jgi:hypothetical protein